MSLIGKLGRAGLGIALLVAFAVLFVLFSFFPELLWFESFGYSEVLWFTLLAKIKLFFVFAGISYFVLRLNLNIAYRISRSISSASPPPQFKGPFRYLNRIFQEFSQFRAQSQVAAASGRAYTILMKIGIVVISILMGLIARHWWEPAYLWLNQSAYGVVDPVFGLDISFYFFSLPVIQVVQNWLVVLVFLSIVISGWVYFSQNILAYLFSSVDPSKIKRHMFVLFGVLLGLMAVGVFITQLELLFSDVGSVYGAGYTDVHARLFGYRVVMWALVIQALLMLIFAFRGNVAIPVLSLGVVVAVWIVLIQIYPGLVQSYVVSPNEIQKELPFIERNVAFTRMAYGLDRIKEINYPANASIGKKEFRENASVFNNIRLWNPGPLKQTFKQLQEIRLYYEFGNVDVDRYRLNGNLEQVMLSAREMDTSQLANQAQTWVNKHLVYTHGYGAVMSPVSQITPEGLPYFYVKDLPPQSRLGFEITRPEIYFGERKSESYVIVNTKQPEFNYPKGSSNSFSKYSGTGGVVLDSIWKRLIYAASYSDIKILISSYIKPESRILYDRQIGTIVRKITPFISFDGDPYLVLTPEGRMVWMLDGYTASDKFPYSEPFRGVLNYIRNSVLVSLDAYSGELIYYIKDESDPIIRAYAGIFPKMFRPLSDLPDSLRAHIRYPKDIFRIQSRIYSTYHMSDPQVFYNREDLWAIPKETYGEQERIMDPYYIVNKGEDGSDRFDLILPFTPTNKNNMVGWLNAGSDPDTYGQLTVYKLPKERTIFGPMQIESRIDQDTEISKSLTLWGQIGSRVIRGNLMVIPFAGSLIYAEPIYLQATQSKLPELKQVILAHENKIVMADNLDDAVRQIVGESVGSRVQNALDDARDNGVQKLDALVDELLKSYQEFRIQSRSGNWKQFGESLSGIDAILGDIEKYRAIEKKKDRK